MRHFCGIETYKSQLVHAAVILQSIPYDGTSTWGKGADKGFNAFMDALDNMEVYDIETNSEVYKKGVHVMEELKDFTSPESMVQAVIDRTREILLLNSFPTFFGGEHSVSIGIIKTMRDQYKDLSVLQLDAHADLRPTYMDSPYNHACALYDSSQHDNLVQVGIRSADKEEMQYAQADNVFFAHDMHRSRAWMQESIDRLGDQVYLTIDLDVFDPSVLPATGTPEPGGIHWYDMLSYLKMLFKQREVVGFDIVELAPIQGERSSEFLTAKLYYKLLSYKFYGS
ncbi:agmatinase [Schleiferiaceae bacterium]|nr:agmatinase [Schleiferiaceae bacterium]